MQWTVPQRSGAVDLRVDPALLTWSRVAEALALHPGLEDRVGVEVDSTVVYLRPRPDREVSREELERFADSLRKSRGVERVVIRGN